MTTELGTIFETLNKPNLQKSESKKLRSDEPWFDLSKDTGKPEYTLQKETNNWKPYTSTETSKGAAKTKKTPARRKTKH